MQVEPWTRRLRAGLIGASATLWALAALGMIDGAPPLARAPNAAWAEAIDQAYPEPEPVPIDGPAQGLVNLSTRGHLGGPGEAMIAGMIVSRGPVTVVLRALGPSLAIAGVEDVVDDPRMQVLTRPGGIWRHQRPSYVVASNDDWRDAENADAIERSGLAPPDPREAALLIQLPAGEHSVMVQGPQAGTTGVVLIEAFELRGAGELVNLSTRGFVGESDEQAMIGGFIIEGDPATLVIRGLGPSLPGDQVVNRLADPRLDLYRDGERVDHNDNWIDLVLAPVLIRRGFNLSWRRESALLVDLPPGEYTVVMRGHPPDDAGLGTGLVEIFVTQALSEGEAELISPQILSAFPVAEAPDPDREDQVWRNVDLLIYNQNVVGFRSDEPAKILVRDTGWNVVAQADLRIPGASGEGFFLPARSLVCGHIRFSRRVQPGSHLDRYEAHWPDLDNWVDDRAPRAIEGLRLLDQHVMSSDGVVPHRHAVTIENRSGIDLSQVVVSAVYLGTSFNGGPRDRHGCATVTRSELIAGETRRFDLGPVLDAGFVEPHVSLYGAIHQPAIVP